MLTALIKDQDKEVEQQLQLPKSKKASQSSNTQSRSSNVWNNKMANYISAVKEINAHNSSQAAHAQQSHNSASKQQQPSTATRMSSATTVSVTTSASRPATTGAKSTMSHIGTFQVTNGTAIWGNPGQPQNSAASRPNPTLGMFTSVPSSVSHVTTEKSSSVVSRQLFPAGDKDAAETSRASSVSLTATYSSPSMAKTRLVDTTPVAFSTKESGNKGPTTAATSRPTQRAPAVGPISRPSGAAVTSPYANHVKPEQQPLPIKLVGTATALQPGGGQSPRVTSATNTAAGGFSPFNNNLFTQVAEGIIGGKKEEEARMNFASVARAGVVDTNSVTSYHRDAAPSTLASVMSQMDPNKAPGYKAPGHQRTTSPHVLDPDMLRYQPFRGNSYHALMNPAAVPMNAPPQPPEGYNPALLNNADYLQQFRQPFAQRGMMPPPAQSAGMPEFSKAPGFHKQQHMSSSQQSMSPRSSASTSVSGGGSGHDQSPHGSLRASLLLRDDEYSSPHTPMTLPKIESNLNPNAPHFMSRHPGHGGGGHQAPGAGMAPNMPAHAQIHPAFRSSYPATPFSTQPSDISDAQHWLAVNNFMKSFGGGGRPGSPVMVPGRGAFSGMHPGPSLNKGRCSCCMLVSCVHVLNVLVCRCFNGHGDGQFT